MSADATPRRHRKAKARHGLSRVRFAPAALVAGALATGALALSMNGTLAAFTASITNGNNTTTNGTLVMQETQTINGTTTTCNSTDTNSVATNTATCNTINKFGGATNLVPGGTSTATITITNTGTATASTFTLLPSACAQSGNVTNSATDLCSKMTINATKTIGGTTSAVGTAGATLDGWKTGAGATGYPIGSVAPNASVSFTFTVTLPSGLGNTYQGLTASQPILWTFSAGS